MDEPAVPNTDLRPLAERASANGEEDAEEPEEEERHHRGGFEERLAARMVPPASSQHELGTFTAENGAIGMGPHQPSRTSSSSAWIGVKY